MNLKVAAQGMRKFVAGHIQPLARPREQAFRLGQHPRQLRQVPLAVFQALAETGQHAALEIHGLRQKLGPHRHRQFGGSGRCGGAHVRNEINQRGVSLMPHRRDQRDHAGRRGAHHRLIVEGHQVFHRPTTARHDDQVGPGHERIEAGDGGGDFGGGLLALHRHRPQQHPTGKARFQPVHDVADHRAGGRGDHPDHVGQKRQLLLAGGIEQAFGGQLLAPLLQHRHQRAQARQLHLLDNDLVARRAGIGGQLAGADHFHARFGPDAQARGDPTPNHRIEHRLVVLQVEIDMAGGMEFQARNLAPHPDHGELVFHRPLQGGGQFCYRKFGQVGNWCVGHGPMIQGGGG